MEEKYTLRELERLVEIKGDGGVVVLLPMFEIEVSPRSEQRYAIPLNSALNRAIEGRITSAEQICSRTVEEIRQELPELEHIVVKMQADYIVFRRTPVTGYENQEMFRILGHAELKDGRVINMIGAEVTGTTACPCAHEGLVERAKLKLEEKGFSEEEILAILGSVPIASHNQRNVSQLMIETSPRVPVDIEDIIEVLEESMSSRLYEVLKRGDEVEVVYQAHLNPSFAEDAVRKIILNALSKFSLTDETAIFARSESFESIHQHNAIAECSTTVERLRKAGVIES